MDKNFCVYRHTNKKNGKVYIGITGQHPEKRWANGRGYYGCTSFWNAIQEYGWDGFNHDILFDHLSRREAERKEIELIKHYNATDSRYGYNMLQGGGLGGSKHVYQYDRTTGIFTREWDSLISAEYELGIPNADISAVCLGKAKTAHNFYFSYEHLGETLPVDIYTWINTNDCAVPIAQYDLDGNFLAAYPSKAEASRAIGMLVQMSSKSSGGYLWRYIIDPDMDYMQQLPQDELPKNAPPINAKPCYQYDLSGKFIRSFKSTTEAAEQINGKQTPIAFACRNHSASYNTYWRYATDVNDTSDLPQTELEHIHGSSKAVYQYDLSGNLIEVFHSVSQAAEKNGNYTGNIAKCCKGKLQTTGGYIYRYEPMTFSNDELDEILVNSHGHAKNVKSI